jgi:hypothetical protein
MSSSRIPIILATAFAFGCSDNAVAPTAQSDGPMLAGSAVIHRVSVGGPDACAATGDKPGCDANFSLTAVQRADGSVTGEGQDQLSHIHGGTGVHVQINCLLVIGNQAWVSGVIEHSSRVPELLGGHVIARVQDNGTTANDPPDLISIFEEDVYGGCLAAPNLQLFQVPQGQVVVQ